MTNIAETVVSEVQNEFPAFEVDDLRRTLADAELDDIVDELVEAFLDDAPSRMAAIESAVAATSSDDVRTTAHAYKSAAASMGARQLAEFLRQMEIAGSSGDTARASALLPMVRAAHESVVAPLRHEFDIQ